MQGNNTLIFWNRILMSMCLGLMLTAVQAGTPLWTFEPLSATTITVPANGTATIQYRITNQSSRLHTLVMQSMEGITQISTGLGVCGNPIVLPGKNSCILSLQINGSQLNGPITDGPVVCQQGSTNQCYRPSSANILLITQAPPITDAIITLTGSPLTLTANSSPGQLTITNMSTQVAATNIASNFTSTALDGNVTETGNTCANVPPGASCTLTYTPGNTVVPQTDFTIQGTNTNALTASIIIQSGGTLSAITPNSGTTSGGTGVTLTGTGLTGATAVTFDGVLATSVNVVNSTTVTAVTPAHAAGPVDVVINTPSGATLAHGYTYVTTAIGQPSGGGTIACLGGGLQNMIAATADNSTSIPWGGSGTSTNAFSDINGAFNTTLIVGVLGAGSYAAQLCNTFEIDSQGNSPCQAGNTCYNDWFLPSKDQLVCLYTNRVAIGGLASPYYWSSTEFDNASAWFQDFNMNLQFDVAKTLHAGVRCARTFTP